MDSISSEHEQLLWKEWLRILCEEWPKSAGYEKEVEWAEKLGLAPRTLRSWRERITDRPASRSLAQIIEHLYKLSTHAGGETEFRLNPAEVLDWLALLGYTAEEVCVLITDSKVQKWLKEATIDQQPLTEKALPSDYIEREITNQIIQGLSGLQGYRRPLYRVVVLYGAVGSGKRTLAAAVSRLLQAQFRNGGRCLRQQDAHWLMRPGTWLLWTGKDEDPVSQWQKWLSNESTVGLVILQDINSGQVVKELLDKASPQIRFLITVQDRDTVEPVLSGTLSGNEVLSVRVGGLTLVEAEELVTRWSHETLTEMDRTFLRRVLREISQPGSLRLLTGAAQDVGWETIWQWIHDGQDANTRLGAYWEEILARVWQRLRTIEQDWLLRLAYAIQHGGTFGQFYAACVWGVNENLALERLQVLERRGWIELVDEFSRGTPPQIARWLGGQRYRLLREAWAFLQEQPGEQVSRQERLDWAEKLRRHMGKSRVTPLWWRQLQEVALLTSPELTSDNPAVPNGLPMNEHESAFSSGYSAYTDEAVCPPDVALSIFWQEQGGWPPEEIWLLYETSRLNTFSSNNFWGPTLIKSIGKKLGKPLVRQLWEMAYPIVVPLVTFKIAEIAMDSIRYAAFKNNRENS